jgi:hypothetical protein
MATADSAKRGKPAAGPTHLPHKRVTGAYVAQIVSLKELLRFVHSHGQAGAAVEWVAARPLALITVAQLHEPVGTADTPAHRASSAPDWSTRCLAHGS